MMNSGEDMKTILEKLYPLEVKEVYRNIQKLIQVYKTDDTLCPLNELDSMLITYGDSLLSNDSLPLVALREFLSKHVGNSINIVHVLPMFPYTSDDGFSVVDYLRINESLGDWMNIKELSNEYELMFDAVINHISKSSEWFKNYQKGIPEYDNFFIECSDDIDYSSVVRPRSLPLYYTYPTVNGDKLLWATFSEDQLDVNYENPRVLIKVLEVLLEYAQRGAKFIRFDAIGFIWKKVGTRCIHLEETHQLVKLMRMVLTECFPNIRIISETNVPHKENISYFGNGYDEAHMIYQFPLPPLTLFSFLKGNATKLSQWADSLKETPLTDQTTYFNFLASHDGIGLRPTEGILTEEEKDVMVQATLNRGGKIGYKNNSDGTKSPYELNINYLDAICGSNMSISDKAKKFMASQMVLLSIKGVPGIYIHSLLGSINDIKGMEQSNINRRINREKINISNIESDFKDHSSLRYKVFSEYKKLLDIRKQHSAFSPMSKQEVLFINDAVFSIIREDEVSGEKILVLINVSNKTINLKTKYTGVDILLNGTYHNVFTLIPYEYLWIKLE